MSSHPQEYAPLVSLGDVADLRLGKMLDARKNRGQLRPYLRNPNVRWFDVDLSDLQEMPFEDHEIEKYALKAGDVVICEGGEAGRAAIWPTGAPQVLFQKAIHRVRVGPNLYNRFLVHRLQYDYFHGALSDYYTGATIKHFTGQDLRRYRFPLPPLPEQRRIAAILDQADALRRRREVSIGRLNELIYAIFFQMFSSNIGNAIVSTSGEPPRMPDEWHWKRLQDVAEMRTGHTPSRKIPDYWNGDIPWLALGDVRRLDGRVALETAEKVTKTGIKNSSAVLLPADTVCVARTASVGFVTLTGREMSTSQDFVNWICRPTLDPMYLMWALISSRTALQSLAPGSTHHTIYFRLFELLHIAVPPLKLQKHFKQAVVSIRTVEKAFKNQATTLEELFLSIQHDAFSATQTEPQQEARKAMAAE